VVGQRLIQHDYGAIVGGKSIPYRAGAFPIGELREDPAFVLEARLAAALRQALADHVLPVISAETLGTTSGRQPRLVFGTIVTGDSFVNCAATRLRLYETWRAQAVEMEGAAVAQVAQRFEVPAIVIRALSDLAGEESHLDFGRFVAIASAAAADVVRRVVQVVD